MVDHNDIELAQIKVIKTALQKAKNMIILRKTMETI
jgi:hypothetical protein